MNAEHTIDKPAWAARATQIAAMVITGLVAVIWMYFGRLYLIHDPGEWRIANQQRGYPLYIIPLIGMTHILGGVGLLIPNVPRLTGVGLRQSRDQSFTRFLFTIEWRWQYLG